MCFPTTMRTAKKTFKICFPTTMRTAKKTSKMCFPTTMRTAKKTSKMCFPTTMRTAKKTPVLPLKIHFLGRKGLIIGLYGVVFHEEHARDVQKCVAPQNNMKNLKNLKTNLEKSGSFFSESRKMKCRESSETCFAEV